MTLARASLVRPGDFPANWVVGTGSRREACGNRAAFDGVTASVTSDSFTQGNVNVQQSVWLFGEADAAKRAFAQMDGRSGRACFRRRVTARMVEQNTLVVDGLSLVQRHQRLGVRRSLWVAKISRLVESPLGQMDAMTLVNVDVIERRRGRGVSTVVVVAADQQPDPSVIRSVIGIAGRRLRAAVTARS